MQYQIIKYDPLTIKGTANGVAVVFGERNSEYQEYLQWLADGNVPDPPPLPPDPSTLRPSVEERLQAAETLINLILDEDAI